MFNILTGFRQRASRLGLPLCLFMQFSGCTLTPIAESTLEARRLGREFPTYRAPPESDAPPPPFIEPRGELTLRAALAAALLNSPALAAFSWEVRAREARALQAGLRQNPQAELKIEEFGGSGDRTTFDAAEATLLLGQLFEFGGKRLKRQRVATLERDLAAWDYETRRLDVLTAVAKVFVATLAAQEQVGLAQEQIRIAQEAVRTIAGQVQAGAVSPVEKTRAQMVLASSQVELTQRKREQTTTRLQLAATWGSTEVTFSSATGNLETVSPPPSAKDLLPRLAHNPDIARWPVEKERRQARLDLEQARQIPNIEMGAGVRYFSADDTAALIFETRMPLMLFDSNQGGVQEAAARLAKAKAEQRAAEVHSRTALTAAQQALFSVFEEVSSLRDTILPQARTALEEVRQAYLRGLFRYLDVLDAQHTLFELRRQYIEALASYHTAVADVERLIAEPLNARQPPERTP